VSPPVRCTYSIFLQIDRIRYATEFVHPTAALGRGDDHLHTGGRPVNSNAYELGVKNPEKTLKIPNGSVYEQVMSGPG
jgi:hypothetical protein